MKVEWKKVNLNPLYFAAAKTGHLKILLHLSERGKNSHTGIFKTPKTSDGKMPLHFAAAEGHLDICQFEIERMNDKNPATLQGVTPLHLAAQFGYLEICKVR